MNKSALLWVLGFIVIALLIGSAYFLGTKKAVAPSTDIPKDAAVTPEEKEASLSTKPSWKIVPEGENGAGAPLSSVSVSYNGVEHSLGTEEGSCFLVEGSAWTLIDGEQSGVICWWAGGGVEYGLFEQNGALVVMKGSLDEGDAEHAGMRGGFAGVLTLE